MSKITENQVVSPKRKNYASETALFADQANQFEGWYYTVGEKTYEKLSTSAGVIEDYRVIGGGGKSSTGTALDLSKVAGTNYNYAAASTATSYTTSNPVVNGFASCLINAASEPKIVLTAGVAEVASLQITGTVTTAGNVTVTLDGVATTIAVALNDTAIMVADKIRATAFTGWTTGGTAGTDTVTFTANATGAKTDATYSAGTTGATGTMTTTTQGVTEITAPKISGAAFVANTNMEMVVESKDGTNVRYFFLAI